MRFCVGLFVFSVCVALAYSEECTTNDDCTSTMCATGHVICEHPDADGVKPNGGLCTCGADTCNTRDDCLSPAHPELNCEDNRRHCYDNRCICTRWGSGGGGR